MYVIPQIFLIANCKNMMDQFIHEIDLLILCFSNVYQYGVVGSYFP